MDYFRVSKMDAAGFFADNYTGDLFTVEFTQDNGKSWTTMSTHLSFEGADRKMRGYISLHRDECALWEDKELFGKALMEAYTEHFDEILAEEPDVHLPIEVDVSGTPLCPGHPKICLGNGTFPGFECCCDECSHFLKCFPEWTSKGSAWETPSFFNTTIS